MILELLDLVAARDAKRLELANVKPQRKPANLKHSLQEHAGK